MREGVIPSATNIPLVSKINPTNIIFVSFHGIALLLQSPCLRGSESNLYCCLTLHDPLSPSSTCVFFFICRASLRMHLRPIMKILKINSGLKNLRLATRLLCIAKPARGRLQPLSTSKAWAILGRSFGTCKSKRWFCQTDMIRNKFDRVRNYPGSFMEWASKYTK